jgi:hypothetical protein
MSLYLLLSTDAGRLPGSHTRASMLRSLPRVRRTAVECCWEFYALNDLIVASAFEPVALDQFVTPSMRSTTRTCDLRNGEVPRPALGEISQINIPHASQPYTSVQVLPETKTPHAALRVRRI